MPRTNPAPAPQLLVRGIPVRLIDYHYDGAGVCWVSVETRDSSRKFAEPCSRPPYWVMSNGTTVKKSEITKA